MLNPEHFRMLRLAILRGLQVEQTSPDTFSVGSHSHPRHVHTVNPVAGSCCCPAFGYCTHLALAVDRWHEREADTQTRLDYFTARRLDFGELPSSKDAHPNDKRFLRVAVEQAREKHAALFVTVERQEVSF